MSTVLDIDWQMSQIQAQFQGEWAAYFQGKMQEEAYGPDYKYIQLLRRSNEKREERLKALILEYNRLKDLKKKMEETTHID